MCKDVPRRKNPGRRGDAEDDALAIPRERQECVRKHHHRGAHEARLEESKLRSMQRRGTHLVAVPAAVEKSVARCTQYGTLVENFCYILRGLCEAACDFMPEPSICQGTQPSVHSKIRNIAQALGNTHLPGSARRPPCLCRIPNSVQSPLHQSPLHVLPETYQGLTRGTRALI
jgi:hypothetical protein